MSKGCRPGRISLFFIAVIACILFSSPLIAHNTAVDTAAGRVVWSEFSTWMDEVSLERSGGGFHVDGYNGAMAIIVSGSGVSAESISFTMDYTFSATYGAVIQEVAVTNISGGALTYNITSNGELGSGVDTCWHYVSASGNYYSVSSDIPLAFLDGIRPVISFMYGDSSLNAYSTSLPYTDGIGTHSFTVSGVSIDPGQTQRWLFLGGVGDIDDGTYNRPEQAVSAVTSLMDPSNWPADFTSGLTPSEMAEVINWVRVIPTVTTSEVTSTTGTSASSGGNVTDAGGSSVYARGVCWNTTGSPTVSDSHTSDGSGTGSFTSSITGLSPETTYYVRAYATNEQGVGYGSEISFSTPGAEMGLKVGATPLADGAVYNFGTLPAGSTMVVTFTIENSGGAELTLSGSPVISITGADAGYFGVISQPSATVLPSGSTTFQLSFSPAAAGSRFASIAIGNNDSNENPYYLTLAGTGTAGSLNYIQIRDASGGGGSEVTTHSLTADETYTVYAAGYDQYGNYLSDQSVSWSGTGACSGQLSPTSGTSAVFTAAAAGSGTITADHATATDDSTGTITVTPGTVDSAEVETEHFGTETAGTPFSVTLTVKDADDNVATGFTGDLGVHWEWTATASPNGDNPTKPGNGFVTFSNGVVTVSGFTLTNSDELVLLRPTVEGLSAIAAITVNDGVLSYVKVEDAAGGAGSEVYAETRNSGETLTVYAAGYDQYGNYLSDQSVSWSGTGACSGQLSPTSGTSTVFTAATAGTGTITADHTTATDDTTGNITINAVLPAVTTTAVTSVTASTASTGGEVTETGGAAITARGVCWGTSANPTTAGSHTTEGTGDGSFTSSLSGLSSATEYHVRAYAVNEIGTAYGEERSFTTDASLAEVETGSVIGSVTSGSAQVSGEVVSDGGLDVIRRGICWDTAPNPIVSPSAPAEGGTPATLGESTQEGSGTGPFTSVISPLRAGTRYYVRAYAENSLGIIYGNEETFVTPGDAREAAGSFISEPGSQLVFVLDTGINAEELYGTDSNYTSNSVLQYGHSASKHSNFISITNTNPEHAVTVHFRYFNSDCVDFFDFLVVLTCNDTMMIDPFNFTVPGTDSVNVKDRFFGYPNKAEGTGQSFDAIPASTFADGRFLLFVTASADVKTGFSPEWNKDRLDPDYDNLDLIPYEFINYREENLNTHCGAWEDGSGDAADESLYGSYDVYGGTNGFSDDNLHILNASAVSFNYLTGFQTVAKVTELGAQASYMTTAWARPAVFADGAGGAADMPAPIHALLTGGERIWTEAGANGELVTSVAGDQYILRHEAHAGDQWDRIEDSLGFNWIISEGGALGWEIFPSSAMPAEKQVVNFISFMDNYNGESNLAQGATPSVWDDVSYNIQPVVTIYTVEPFNNSEDPWIPSDPDDQPIVSPVTPESPLVTAIAVKCINTYEIDPESNLNDAVLGYKFGEFTLQDLYDMNAVIGTDSLTLEGFLNVLAGSQNELDNEVGPGWMRLSRWFTTRKWTTVDLYPEYVYSYWQGWDYSTEAPYELTGPTIFTEDQANYVFENFGAGKWLSTVISE